MENALEVVTVPVIAAIVYGVMAVYKQLMAEKPAVWTSLIPVWAGVLGIALGVAAYFLVPEAMPADNVLSAVLLGLASGLSATGLDQVYSELLPADKVEKVEELLKIKPPKAKLAFVGDGINDAPVLGRADIGIAMGAMGSDAAIEAADVVLMDDDPMQISKAIQISRKCLGIVYQNIVFAIGVKLACLVLVALGFANMWLAVFADVGVMILAVLNAIRALFVKNL